MVEKIFDNVAAHNKMIQDDLEGKIKRMQEKVDTVFTINEEKIPLVLDRVAKAEVYIKNIVHFMIKKLVRQYNRERMWSLVCVLRQNVLVKKQDKRKVVCMMNTLRKFHTFWFFHKYRRIINWEVQMKEKNSI